MGFMRPLRVFVLVFSYSLFLVAGMPSVVNATTYIIPAARLPESGFTTNARAEVVEGTIRTSGQCQNISGYYFTIQQNPARTFVLQRGITATIPVNITPTVEQNIFATIGQPIACTRSTGASVEAQTVTYFSVRGLPAASVALPGQVSLGVSVGQSSSGLSGSSGSGSNPITGILNQAAGNALGSLVSGLGNSLSRAVSGGAAGAASAAVSSGVQVVGANAAGAAAIASSILGGGFGGSIKTIVPCTQPPGFFITLLFPSPGLYVYVAGTTRYPTIPPVHPGQWILGKTAGVMECMYGLVLVGGGKLITPLHGTSI